VFWYRLRTRAEVTAEVGAELVERAQINSKLSS
jgi:hypothetical protein